MFVLRKRILAWRAEMLARGVFSPAEVFELEDHLAEEAARLTARGLPDERAFFEALRRLGAAAELEREYAAVHEESGVGWVEIMAQMIVDVFGMARTLVVLVLPGVLTLAPLILCLCHESIANSHFWDEMFGRPSPLVYRASFWGLVLSAMLVIVLVPALYRAWQLRARDVFTVRGWLLGEIREIYPLLPAALLLYPLTAGILLWAVLIPFVRPLGPLGG